MHPNRDEIRDYVLGTVTAEESKAVTEHIDNCEFCAELAEECRMQIEALRSAGQEIPSAKTERMKQRLTSRAFGPPVIHLKELKSETVLTGLLAADGGTIKPRWEHLKTFYCESPDVVVRLVRDTELRKDSLQVIAEDPSLYAHVMVNVPGMDLRLVTDENGHAEVGPGIIERAGDAPWQINLPEAVFALETLEYDPDRTEYTSETILTTPNDDRIKVTFEGKTIGKQFSIEILQLDGKSDFDPVHVVMMADDEVDSWRAGPKMDRKIALKDRAKKIILRLFNS